MPGYGLWRSVSAPQSQKPPQTLYAASPSYPVWFGRYMIVVGTVGAVTGLEPRQIAIVVWEF